MILTFSPLTVQTTTNILASPSIPIMINRSSPLTLSGMMIALSSSNIGSTSEKRTPCFLKFLFAFFASHVSFIVIVCTIVQSVKRILSLLDLEEFRPRLLNPKRDGPVYRDAWGK